MRSQNLEPEAAERARAQFDRAHEAHFRQFYGVQIKDPALSHVVLDSTSIELDACVEMIVRAAESLAPATAAAAVSGPA
jgi:cytidylate kinase